MTARAWVLMLCVALLVGCATRPDIRYYQLDVAEGEFTELPQRSSDVVFSVEAMIGDSAYEDPRIVYRVSPYRLDYYHYHRWTAPPGVLVSDFMRDAYERTGQFRSVVAGFSPDAAVFLSGRVIAFEEVDHDKGQWYARVKLNLFLREAATGDVIWSQTFLQETPVAENTPEGVAAAMSVAVSRIVAQTAPELAELAEGVRDRRTRKKSRERAIDELEQGDQ